ncbi:MAG: hypothetical protein KGL29_04335 [Alphaproteobacteria bacterium]|nr:hypothetical protein [Alphaproteobacteria bacterium]MDE2500136.1 hypothetical protein [Alphaproteobacteria bacterium]
MGYAGASRAACAWLIGLAMLSAVMPALAASGEQASKETVVVTGQRRYDKDRLEDVLIPQFIQTHGTYTHIDQLSRWRTPVCPVVIGLKPPLDKTLIARVRDVAAKVGAPVAASCETDVEIFFTDQPQALLDGFVKRHPFVLGYHYIPEENELKTIHYPIQAWYITATKGGTVRYIDDAYGPTPPGCAGSRLTHCLRSEIVNVLVIADLTKLEGKPLGPISDYIAMVVLSRARTLDACGELPSIMDLLAPACGEVRPEALTFADDAYLKALYDINMGTIGSTERAEIDFRMRRAIEKQ